MFLSNKHPNILEVYYSFLSSFTLISSLVIPTP